MGARRGFLVPAGMGLLALASLAPGCGSSNRRSVPTDTPYSAASPTAAFFYHYDFEPPNGGAGWSTGFVSGAPNSWQFLSSATPAPYAGPTVLSTGGSAAW